MVMNPDTSATLGDPEFPPKNGVIIKQGHLFVQETKKILFMKWKVWRKRWISLRYLSNNSSPVLQIDSRNPVLPAHHLLNLSQESSIKMIDSSDKMNGPQDLATAKALQLLLDPLAEPMIFKHSSETEMSDWMAAFRLTVALGETGSICSDTDSSTTWNESQAAPSPVSSGSPNNAFPTFSSSHNNHDALAAGYTVKIKPCYIAEKLGLLMDQEYQLHVSSQGLTLQPKNIPLSSKDPLVQWPLHQIRKTYMDNASDNKDKDSAVPTSGNSDIICIDLSRHALADEGLLILQSSAANDLCDQLRILATGASNLKKLLADREERLSIRSRGSRRHPGSDRPRKRPLSLIGQRSLLSTEQTSPVASRAPKLQSRENSLRSIPHRSFHHMDSRDSEQSSSNSTTGMDPTLISKPVNEEEPLG